MTLGMQPSSVFLVTGGARGITAQCVIKLAQQLSCKWLLLGRSQFSNEEPAWAEGCFEESLLKKRIMEYFQAQGTKPTPLDVQRQYRAIASRREIQQTLQTLRAMGRQVEYLSVDVTDAIALQTALIPAVQRLGEIKGILHGAGNLADKLIEKKTEHDFELVYAAKVKGLANLLQLVPPHRLDYLVLFSSVSGFYGNAGQTDYALANEILNKSAHLIKHHYPNCRVVAINWGPWESGMVNPALKAAFAERSIDIIPVEAGTQMLVKELSRSVSTNSAQVVMGSPLPIPSYSPLMEELRSHRLRRKLTLEANPFLRDHIIGGHSVLPFTCVLAWMSGAAEQLYPGYFNFRAAQIRALKGIIFDQSLADEYILDFREISKSKDQIQLEAIIWSQNQTGKIRYNYRGQLTLLRQLPQPYQYEAVDLTPDFSIPGMRDAFYQKNEFSLFHGPAFRGVETVLNATPERITARCLVPSLDPRQQGQFPVSKTTNAYTTDVQTHAVWLWLQHFHQAGCLPAKIKTYEKYIQMPYDMPFYTTTEIVSKTETSLTVNIITHDQDGKVYLRLLGAQGTIFPLPFPTPAQTA